MSHDIEQPRHVVLGFVRRFRPGEPQPEQLAPQPGEDLLAAGIGEVVARIGRHLGLAGTDEDLVVLEAGRRPPPPPPPPGGGCAPPPRTGPRAAPRAAPRAPPTDPPSPAPRGQL